MVLRTTLKSKIYNQKSKSWCYAPLWLASFKFNRGLVLEKYVCNYCFKEIDLQKEATIACDKCLSPYHMECWNKYNVCATNGCNSKSFHNINNIIISKDVSKKYICTYCHSEIENINELVFCDECDSPYHIDCWQENNGCATYGCAGDLYHRENRIVKSNNSVIINPEPVRINASNRNLGEYNPQVTYYDNIFSNRYQTIDDFYREERLNSFINVLKCIGAFLYSGLLCFLIWLGFYKIIQIYESTFHYDEYTLYLSITFLVGCLILFGVVIMNLLEGVGVDSEKLANCFGILIAPFFCCSGGSIIGPILFYGIIGGILYLLTLPLSKITNEDAENIISKICALVPVVIFIILTSINCYNMVTATYISVLNCCVPFALYLIIALVIIIDGNIIDFLANNR